jgi:hypothetical protein
MAWVSLSLAAGQGFPNVVFWCHFMTMTCHFSFYDQLNIPCHFPFSCFHDHLDVTELIGSGVQLGNDDRLVILEVLTQLVPDRGKLLAVSAPSLSICYGGSLYHVSFF